MYNPSSVYLPKLYYNYFGYFQVIFFFLGYYTKNNRSFLFGDPKYCLNTENKV